MDYKDLPIEIQIKLKERIEEQGNSFNESLYTADKKHGGFTWRETPEGKTFWDDVLGKGKHHVFYEKYPKEINFDRPFRKDDVVKCISNSFNSNTKVIGKHFQLRNDDVRKLNNGKVASLVSYPSGIDNEYCVNFSSSDLVIVARTEIKLSKQTEKMETKSDFQEGKRYLDEKVGTEYIVVSGSLEGTVVKLHRHDQTECPLFSCTDSDGDKANNYISWYRLKRCAQTVSQTSDFDDKPYPEEKVGTKYLVVKGKWEGSTVVLYSNDNTSMPRFRNEEGEGSWLEWECLKRIDQPKELSTDRYRVKTFEEFGNKTPGDWANDGEMDQFFGHELTSKQIEIYLKRKNAGKSDFQIDDCWWIRCNDIVKIETNNFKLNTYNNEKSSNISSNTFLPRIPSTVSYGTTPRGVAVSCARSKIRVGG